MTRTTETVIDRYITIFDRSARDSAAIEELETIFAPDAIVQLDDGAEPVTGSAAIIGMYRGIAASMADSKHFWTTEVLDDGRIECHWVQAARATDGELATRRGIEHATVGDGGLITHLRNRLIEPGDRA